ncbi:unnamed protein product [Rotaria magnacalcarata]|uniref:Uncharacterized protein n=1 Tax=Rotaria magnacalcarata TaxID=392030 RepID=A0A816XXT8_9BILA|nr:unnamed protein product [Rotaria magnacalcarata]
MATILSLPVRQQQDSSKSNIVTSKFPKHFGVKIRINRMFKWCNKLRYMHMLILVFCTHIGFWLPLMSNTSTETMELSTNRINVSLAVNEIYDRAYAKRCLSLPPSLLLSTSIDNIRSYSSMSILIVFLCFGSESLILVAQMVYDSVSRDQLDNPYKWFCWCRKVLILLVGSSLFHQLSTALACRPMDILYDFRYTSMLIVQITGFFICLLFAFFLGVKFASIKPVHSLAKSSNMNHNNIY